MKEGLRMFFGHFDLYHPDTYIIFSGRHWVAMVFLIAIAPLEFLASIRSYVSVIHPLDLASDLVSQKLN